MIGFITGQVQYLMAPTACIMTSSGVGYDVELPLSSFCQLQVDAPAQIWTHFHVREDAQLLYGFIERKERDVFRQLIKINGVGAKMALAMLSAMSAAELKMHVEQNSETALTRIPGIGKKTAQRLLIELKDKLKNIEVDTSSAGFEFQPAPVSTEGSIIAEVEGALISLGYKEREAQQAIKAAKSNGDTFDNTQHLLKATLQQLSGF